MNAPKWIRFELTEANTKTPQFKVVTMDGSIHLGIVKFRPQWWKFAFFPFLDTLYEADCLRDIATFCEERTAAWRSARAGAAS